MKLIKPYTLKRFMKKTIGEDTTEDSYKRERIRIASSSIDELTKWIEKFTASIIKDALHNCEYYPRRDGGNDCIEMINDEKIRNAILRKIEKTYE